MGKSARWILAMTVGLLASVGVGASIVHYLSLKWCWYLSLTWTAPRRSTPRWSASTLTSTARSARRCAVQLTPPGSGCSIQVGKGITDMSPGSLGGPSTGRPRPRGRARNSSGEEWRPPREPGVQRGWPAPETRRRVPRQRRVRLLRRPGWQRLDRPADQLPRLVRKDI
jgi:hypothetical protein